MMWRAYKVVFRLRSPLHIGWGKVGNLQRTRSYVTGRVLWGALTMRLTRDDAGHKPATDSRSYREFGKKVNQNLAFTYFYPATRANGDYQIDWPWQDKNLFRRRFLGSYQGTALAAVHQSAAVGMLHEVEFISPYTMDTGEPVFLLGYIFERQGNTLLWKEALDRIQLGGERGYGWGDVELIELSKLEDDRLFGGKVKFDGTTEKACICVPAEEYVMAHTVVEKLPVKGEVEPLVGREWRSNNSRCCGAGQHVEFVDVCFAPGSIVNHDLKVEIGDYGVWRGLSNNP